MSQLETDSATALRTEALERLRRPAQHRTLFRRRPVGDPGTVVASNADDHTDGDIDGDGGHELDGRRDADGDGTRRIVRRRRDGPDFGDAGAQPSNRGRIGTGRPMRSFARMLAGPGDGPPSWPLARLAVPLVAIVLVAALVVAWFVLRRPEPVEQALPYAGAAPTSTEARTATDRAGGSSDSQGGVASAAGGRATSSTAVGSPAGRTDSSSPVMVHIAGAVVSPGVVTLSGGARVVDAVTAAGGMKPDADPDRVNLAARLTDGERLVVPVVGQPAPQEVLPTGPTGSADPSGDTTATGAAAAPVDLNTASADQLDALPGVGPATANAIITYRQAHGPFHTIDDLLDVRGIGDAKLDSLRDLVSVGS